MDAIFLESLNLSFLMVMLSWNLG